MGAFGPIGMIGGATIGAIEKGVSGKKNRENQLKLQQNNQQFQEHMASTNYQRMTADMKKAGINPVMAASGSGTAAPISSQKSSGLVGNAAYTLLKEYSKTGHLPKVSTVRPN